MDYVTVRELRSESGKVWDRVAAGEEIVVTRNGKPFALILHAEPSEVEAALRAYRAARLGMVLDRIQTHARTHGLDQITDDEIDAEIAAVRRKRAPAARSSRQTHAQPRRR